MKGTPAGSVLQQNEEIDRYFQKWLDSDVVYIISEEERKVFLALTTVEEREQFIEQFWFRRDPDPRTSANQVKEEHYRRIAYANEHFFSGIQGWQTDRGRIYIIHGPPAEIESHPSGGSYDRPSNEGGGTTSTYPFEVWRYRHVEGLGSDIEIEFVDPTMSGEYRLALNPEEKDALLFVPGAGLTTAESMGLSAKADRPFFSPGNTNRPFRSNRLRDNPFQRYETYARIQRPSELKYKDLKGTVEVGVQYDDLPFRYRIDSFRLNAYRSIIPVTIEVANRDLDFRERGAAVEARLAVYGRITSLGNRVVEEFETDLATTYRSPAGRSAFQKVVLLERKGRYKLDLIVKDLNSGKMGVQRTVIVPGGDTRGLSLSSLLLSDSVGLLAEAPEQDAMFVLGDVRIRPSLGKVFPAGAPLQVYLQAYNARLDQSTQQPALKVRYLLSREGEVVRDILDVSGESIQFFSSQRVVLLRPLATGDLAPGRYRVAITVTDTIGDGEVRVSDRFEIRTPPPAVRK